MANTPQRNESMNQLSKEIVLNDPALQQALKGLVRDSIAVAIHTMRHGSPTDKMALMKTLTPHMLEALRQTQQNERAAAEEAAYQRILAEMRGDTPVEAG